MDYEEAKEFGKCKEDPDHRKNWKKYIYKRNAKARSKEKKTYNSQIRNFRKEEIKYEDARYISRNNIRKMKSCDEDIGFQTLREIQIKRSGRYCEECEDMFCQHRARKSSFLIIYSQRKKDGDFSRFPKEIALMIAKLVYRTQLDFAEQFYFDLQPGMTPSLFSEVHYNYIYFQK